MTIEEKQLLIQDLCGRLPYDVIVRCCFVDGGGEEVLDTDDIADMLYSDEDSEFPMYKPYLRPMSNMTEDERIEFIKLFDKWHNDELFDYIEEGVEFSIWKHKGISAVVFDWLNAYHFDYRGLIPMGLAIEAPEGMYE